MNYLRIPTISCYNKGNTGYLLSSSHSIDIEELHVNQGVTNVLLVDIDKPLINKHSISILVVSTLKRWGISLGAMRLQMI